MGFLFVAIPVQGKCQIFHMNWFAFEDLVHQPSNGFEDFGPDVEEWASEGGWVPGTQHCRVSVVVKQDALRPPGDKHGLTGVEHDSHEGGQRLRPIHWIAQWHSVPIQSAEKVSGISPAREGRG